jgi:hypothetical protein
MYTTKYSKYTKREEGKRAVEIIPVLWFKIPNWNLEGFARKRYHSRNTLMPAKALVLRPNDLQEAIHLIRGQKVLLDRDLAALYGVTTGNLNKAVRRNVQRFPRDFMFELSREEADSLSFQIGILKRGQHFKYLPRAFTEQGVAMLSSVLNSPRAIQVNIAIMRVFVRLRETLSLHKELAHKLEELEKKIQGQDEHIHTLFDAIRQLTEPAENSQGSAKEKEMGFHIREDAAPYYANRKAPRRRRA